MSDDLIEVHLTVGSLSEAESISDALVSSGLAACVQAVPGVRSAYVWQGQTDVSEEILLLAKTTAGRFDALASRVRDLHSYDVPEIIATRLSHVDAAYAEWLRAAVGDASGEVSDQVEIERKFTVTDETEVPDSGSWPGVAEVGEARTHDLHATYFDSDDVRLARHRTTLRRRTGGDDDGWHLKLPQEGDERLEKRLPLSSSADKDHPPAELLDMTADILDGVVVQAVCEVDTHRVERDLMRADGTMLAIRCDDHVQTRNLLDPSLNRQWAEIEVELVDGAMKFLDEVTAYLEEHGVRQASFASKLQEALGALLDEAQPASRSDDG